MAMTSLHTRPIQPWESCISGTPICALEQEYTIETAHRVPVFS